MKKGNRCAWCETSLQKDERHHCSVCSREDKNFVYCNLCIENCEYCERTGCYGCGSVNDCNVCRKKLCRLCMGRAACDYCNNLNFCEDCINEHERNCGKKKNEMKN